MIPLKLTLEGLYSYQERQTIDFENLASNGLFGILGGVGSGKSSILEAVTFALYGETERLNRNNRAYNMMNLKSDRLYIDFEFMNHDNNVFRITREMKRNSKNFDIVRTPTVQFYQKDGDNWLPLDHSDAESIIGLSYINFRRTIIIPQGQFKEFLELGATDRTTMMKEIFELHRFDLQNKVSAMISENKSLLDKVSGRLMEFESVNEEDIGNKGTALRQLQEELQSIGAEHDLISERYQRLKALKGDFMKLQELNINYERYKALLPDMDKRKAELERYEKVLDKFDKPILDLRREEKLLKQLDLDNQEVTKLWNDSRVNLESKQDKQKEMEPVFARLPERRKEESELELVGQILGYKAQIARLEERTKNGREIVDKKNNELQGVVQQVAKLEEGVEVLSANKYDSALLMEIDAWYLTHDNLIANEAKYRQELNGKQTELKNLTEEADRQKIDIDNFSVIADEAVGRLDINEKEIGNQKSSLELQQKMADYANALHDGVPCPLCGSSEHPHIANVGDVSEQLSVLESALIEIKQERERWSLYKSSAQRFYDRRHSLLEQIEGLNNQLSDVAKTIGQHVDTFRWSDFRPEAKNDFERKKKESLEIEKQLKGINAEIATLRQTEKSIRDDLVKYQDALEKLKGEETELKTRIDSNKSFIHILRFEDYENSGVADINRLQEELKKENDGMEASYNGLVAEITELDKRVGEAKVKIDMYQSRMDQTRGEVVRLNGELSLLLKNEGYADLNVVEAIICKKLDVTKERLEINNFMTQLEVLNSQIKGFKDVLDKAEYDDSVFDDFEKKWLESQNRFNEHNKKVVELNAEFKRLQVMYAAKVELIKKYDELDKRAKNLGLMFNLFKAQGFVQYVSSIYLAQLCDQANERFRRMTRNQLRLQVNDNNEFEIVDYLNEGRTRSVRTLSGGQSFQVSLSLALALAESVQSNAKAEKNFFFIDEGFGTQDMDSVNIVFETLLNLNKENKIVGIISHVEELKERIPMTLTVVKDPERGSLLV